MYFLKRWEKKKDLILAATLFSLNLFFLWPFFGQDYPQANFSTPVLPLLAKVLDFLTPLSFTQAVGIFVLFSFPLASFAWYLFFQKLSGNSLLSFLAGLIFLLPWFYLPRFALFWQRGDGTHALGFAILPLVGVVLKQFLRNGSLNFFLASFLGVSLVALISPFALFNLYLVFLVLTFSEMLLGQARIKILRFLIILLFAQGFSSFWYHPEFLLSLVRSGQGQEVLVSIWKLLPLSFFTAPVLGVFSFLIFDRKPNLQPVFFAFILTVIYLSLVAAENFGDYLPFPFLARFFPEFYIGLSLFLAITLKFLINLPRQGFSLGKIHPRLVFVHHASDLFLTTFLTALLVWPVFSLFMGSPIIARFDSPQVLGVQSVWWEVSHDGVSQLVGYGMSFLTAATGIFLRVKIKT